MCARLTERAGHPRFQSTHAPAPLQNQASVKAVLTTPSRALQHVQIARARLHCNKLLSTGVPAAHMQMLHVHACHSTTLAVKQPSHACCMPPASAQHVNMHAVIICSAANKHAHQGVPRGLPRLFSQSAILYCSFILQTPATLKNMDTP
jgi:hypothetical protein